MSRVFIIADLHLSHKSMSEKRGFKSVEDHDQYIINQWNKVVNKKDLVYILGDITMESKKFYPILDKLIGKKNVILGNHDMMNHIPELMKYVQKVAGMVRYSTKTIPKLFLTHCPIHPMELDYRVNLNIHGHIHENLVLDKNGNPDPRYICVSCEHIDYTPQLISDLIKRVP